MPTEIKLQPLKEGVESVEINEFLVSAGDTVSKDQPVIEVQADKSSLEVVAPEDGKIVKFLVEVGDEIPIGQALYSFEAGASEGGDKKEDNEKEEVAEDSGAEPEETTEEESKSETPPKEEKPAPAPASGSEPQKKETQEVGEPGELVEVLAGPATRQLARELGVDLRQVTGTARNNRVTEEDVRTFVRKVVSSPAASNGAAVRPAPPLPDFETWGEIEREPMRGIRKATAQQMAVAWSQIPHVTQHDEADITELEAFRKEQKAKGEKLTVTAFALKALAIALKKFPRFNSSLDPQNNQLILKKYFHVGVAVDTPNGLLVPVIRDVDSKSVSVLASELNEVAERARDGKLDMEELKGGCLTLTNLGGIGGTSFTPIVNHPEVAILGLSRGKWQPVYVGEELARRLVLPLSLSYDHRVIDGADAARFTRYVADLLQEPKLMLLHA